jgi:hypothetical protein
MWEPRRLPTLWAFTACYRDSFTFLFLPTLGSLLVVLIKIQLFLRLINFLPTNFHVYVHSSGIPGRISIQPILLLQCNYPQNCYSVKAFKADMYCHIYSLGLLANSKGSNYCLTKLLILQKQGGTYYCICKSVPLLDIQQ